MFNMPSGPKLSLALVALLSVLFGVMFVTTQKQQAKQEALKKAAAKAAAENEAAFNNLSPAEHLAQAKKLLNVDASQASVSDGLKHIAAIDQGSPLLKDATTVLPGLDMSMSLCSWSYRLSRLRSLSHPNWLPPHRRSKRVRKLATITVKRPQTPLGSPTRSPSRSPLPLLLPAPLFPLTRGKPSLAYSLTDYLPQFVGFGKWNGGTAQKGQK